MGVDIGDRRLRLLAAVWGAIIMTALADLTEDGVDWANIGIDDVVARLDETFAEFTGEIEGLRQPG